MKRNRNSTTSNLATIEVDSSRLHVCVITRAGEQVSRCQSRSIAWRREATTLHSEAGQAEIAEGLRRVAGELKIAGVPTWLSLTGDYCVTRVVSGDDETVRRELAELEQRSALYLSLGHGPKTLAAGVRQIDARHRHALLSVVNQKTLSALVDAAGRAGLQLDRIEPSLVSLCRLIGQMQFDAQAPVLVLSVGERGAELGISHRGVLLLDYRPAGTDLQPAQLAETITRHLARLQRYCQRYMRFAAGKLANIYLSGPPEIVSEVRSAFARHGQLVPHLLEDPWSVKADWPADRTAPEWTMAAPLGLTLLAEDVQQLRGSPNLLERMRAVAQEPLGKLLRPLAWPLAASFLAVALGWGAVWYQSSRCQALEKQVARLEVDARDARLLQTRCVREQALSEQYQRIDAALAEADWAQLTGQMAQCLPDDVWLDSFHVTEGAKLRLTGKSYSEDGVFEFVKWLGEVPRMDNVAIDGTRNERLPSGNGLQFDIQGEISRLNEHEGGNDETG
jgi:Tfp pilus assembly protein PilN